MDAKKLWTDAQSENRNKSSDARKGDSDALGPLNELFQPIMNALNQLKPQVEKDGDGELSVLARSANFTWRDEKTRGEIKICTVVGNTSAYRVSLELDSVQGRIGGPHEEEKRFEKGQAEAAVKYFLLEIAKYRQAD